MNWKEYWEESAGRFGEKAFCQQVGRTVSGGQPVNESQLERVVEDVARRLTLEPQHALLDLCCGNGLLTVRLAKRARTVVGVDFSPKMIALARANHGGEQITYLEASVTELGRAPLEAVAPFDRACLIESLHYFGPEELAAILEQVTLLGSPALKLYLPGVLDLERQDRFYDTPERRAAHALAQAEDRDPMGRWWKTDELSELAAVRGFAFERFEQDPALTTAHYRFDALLSRRPA